MAENDKKPLENGERYKIIKEDNSAMLKIFDKIVQNAKSTENDTSNKNEKEQ